MLTLTEYFIVEHLMKTKKIKDAKSLLKKYHKEEKRHDVAEEAEESKHEKSHDVAMDKALKIKKRLKKPRS